MAHRDEKMGGKTQRGVCLCVCVSVCVCVCVKARKGKKAWAHTCFIKHLWEEGEPVAKENLLWACEGNGLCTLQGLDADLIRKHALPTLRCNG